MMSCSFCVNEFTPIVSCFQIVIVRCSLFIIVIFAKSLNSKGFAIKAIKIDSTLLIEM